MQKRRQLFLTLKRAVLLQSFVSILLLINIVAANGEANGNLARHTMKTTKEKKKKISFYEALNEILTARGVEIEMLYESEDAVSQRILEEYGAIFVAGELISPPPVCLFGSADAVDEFQKSVPIGKAEIAGATIELQQTALDALLAARADALDKKLDITPRDGSEAARRSYADSIRLWNSRFSPALEHWQKLGEITVADAEKLKSLALREQVAAVLELETRGVFFSTYFDKSILYSVAAPGASQHLALLAFDTNEFADKRIRKILARHGWFRTVRNDAPHFTFLGLPQKELPARGLKRLKTDGGDFWIPNVKNGVR